MFCNIIDQLYFGTLFAVPDKYKLQNLYSKIFSINVR